MSGRLSILIIDDSATMRALLRRALKLTGVDRTLFEAGRLLLLSDALGREADLEVVGTAADFFIAHDLLLKHDPDAMTLDHVESLLTRSAA